MVVLYLPGNNLNMHQTILYKDFFLEYEEFGKGKEILIAFHGFDGHSSDFKVFEPSFGNRYTIYSFNLFYHGNSQSPNPQQANSFTNEDLRNIIQAFLTKKSVSSFSLLAYSLGGKIALACIELFPDKIKDVFLFAPDGVKLSNWYKFASNTLLGRMLFKFVIRKPDLFLRIVLFLQKTGLVHEKMYKFLSHQMETQERRQKVYDIWVVFRKVVPNIPVIQQHIKKNHIQLHLFFGKYDAVIPPALGVLLAKGLPGNDVLHLLDMGHTLITEKTNVILHEKFKAHENNN